MKDEFTARQRAISLRLSGRSVQTICRALGRSPRWFNKWWRRYLESGTEGLTNGLDRSAAEAERDGTLACREFVAHGDLRGAAAGGCPRGSV